MKKIVIYIVIIIISVFISPVVVLATSGRISSSSIITCNGRNYGNHGDGHWHISEQRGSFWYAVGESLGYDNPCGGEIVTPPTVNYIYGCTDVNATNYNSEANKDDNSCRYIIYGCTDKNAINYNSSATTNDNTCKYQEKQATIDSDDNLDKDNTINQDNNANTELSDNSNVKDVETEISDSTAGIITLLSIGGGIGSFIYYKKKKKQ